MNTTEWQKIREKLEREELKVYWGLTELVWQLLENREIAKEQAIKDAMRVQMEKLDAIEVKVDAHRKVLEAM